MFGKHKDLENELRGLRQEPSDELVSSVSASVRPARRVAWSRAAFAGAFATLVLGSFASFGGVGYASSAAQRTVHSVYSISKTSAGQTSAQGQYSKPKAKVAKVSAKHITIVKKAHPASAAAGKAKTLPFTGLSLGLTFGLALGLIVLGLALRRREAHDRA